MKLSYFLSSRMFLFSICLSVSVSTCLDPADVADRNNKNIKSLNDRPSHESKGKIIQKLPSLQSLDC